MIGETITLRRGGTGAVNRYGDAAVPYTDVPLTADAIYPRTSSESEEPGRDRITDGITVKIPAGTLIDPRRDLFVVRGNTYEVDGEPGDYRSPFTGLCVLTVNLTRVRG